MGEKLQPGKISGDLGAAGFRFGIVVSRLIALSRSDFSRGSGRAGTGGSGSKDIDVAHVRERSNCAGREKNGCDRKVRRADRYWMCASCETTHYDYVCSETARGLQLAQMDTGLPIIFCVLTCDTLEQPSTARTQGGNKGFEPGSQP